MNSRFLNADGTDEDKNIREVAGYKKLEVSEIENLETGNKEEEPVIKEFWILPDVFKREILQNRNGKIFYKQLIASGYILSSDADNKTSQIKRVAGQNPKRFIVVPATILDN